MVKEWVSEVEHQLILIGRTTKAPIPCNIWNGAHEHPCIILKSVARCACYRNGYTIQWWSVPFCRTESRVMGPDFGLPRDDRLCQDGDTDGLSQAEGQKLLIVNRETSSTLE